MALMLTRRLLLVVLAGAAPLASASFMEGCGNAAQTGDGTSLVDGAAQDAKLDTGHVGMDAAPDADDGGPPTPVMMCADAGFITISGDGPLQTLRSNSFPNVFHAGDPQYPWAVAYYHQGLSLGGSATPDGGASLLFDVEIVEDQDGGLTIFGPGSAYSYATYTRQDGTLFSPTSGLAASVTLTEADPPGGIVAGSYTATVVDSTQPDASTLSLSGTFSACRLHDTGGPTPPHHE
jgi:hypothetical protein